MRSTRRLFRLGAVAAGLALAGCAPTFGPGLQLGVNPMGDVSLGTGSCFLTGSGYAVPHGMSRTAAPFSVLNRISQIQARFSLGHSDVRSRMESARRIASGDC
ncbi:MAG TPA: hypothetical protein VGR37_04265 [Longimicrobiaceae bacterium]|nr:hypothetical protein [Longimicrobiaceae bacterium]